MVQKKVKLPISKTHPKLAKEAVGWDASLFTYGSNKKLEWRCKKGHLYLMSPAKRTMSGQSCPICANRVVLAGFNDLKTTHPELSKEVDGWDPTQFTFGSHEKVTWICSKNHRYQSMIKSRVKGSACPYCAGRLIKAGFNDLEFLNPKIAQEAFGWDPKTYSVGSNKKVKWKCSFGHIYTMSIDKRTSSKMGCAVCAGRQINVGINDLASTNPELAKEAFGWDPKHFTAGSSKQLIWRCSLNHEYSASPVSRTSRRKQGCPYCNHHAVLSGFNDLETLYPFIAKEAFGWEPSKYMGRSNKKLKWKCDKAHVFFATIVNRTVNQSGCPTCSRTGFDPNLKGYIYFISHEQWNMFQIGITNNPNDRLNDHRKLGWELLEIRGPMDGHFTQQTETAILRMLKAKGADLSNKEIVGKFDGYSEAWSKSTFPVKSIKELMRLTEEFEERSR